MIINSSALLPLKTALIAILFNLFGKRKTNLIIVLYEMNEIVLQ